MSGDVEPYYGNGMATIYHGRAEDVVPHLADVDLVFTSPRYNLGVSPGGVFGNWKPGGKRGGMGKWKPGADTTGVIDYDANDDATPYPEYRAWQHAVLSACWDALSDVGAIFYNHKPRVQRDGLLLPLDLIPQAATLRQIITWDRGSGMNFAPTNYLPVSEWIMVLARDGWRLKSRGASGLGDVWRVAPESGSEHPAPFPLALPERAIDTCAPSLVLDPFCGSGTTLRAAQNAGVRSIGVDVSERYCEMAANRLEAGDLFGWAS